MFTLQDIANLFGGSIPTWFWVVAAIVAVVLFVVFGGLSSATKSYGKGDIKISRDSDGSYYAYDKDTETVLYSAATKQEVANWVASQVR